LEKNLELVSVFKEGKKMECLLFSLTRQLKNLKLYYGRTLNIQANKLGKS
jgi:hypothetical protein